MQLCFEGLLFGNIEKCHDGTDDVTDTDLQDQPRTDTMLRPFSEDLARAQERRRQQQETSDDTAVVSDGADQFGEVVTEPRELFADADSAAESPEPVPYEQARLVASSRVASNTNFRDELARRSAEAKTAGEIDCETFDFDALDQAYYER